MERFKNDLEFPWIVKEVEKKNFFLHTKQTFLNEEGIKKYLEEKDYSFSDLKKYADIYLTRYKISEDKIDYTHESYTFDLKNTFYISSMSLNDVSEGGLKKLKVIQSKYDLIPVRSKIVEYLFNSGKEKDENFFDYSLEDLKVRKWDIKLEKKVSDVVIQKKLENPLVEEKEKQLLVKDEFARYIRTFKGYSLSILKNSNKVKVTVEEEEDLKSIIQKYSIEIKNRFLIAEKKKNKYELLSYTINSNFSPVGTMEAIVKTKKGQIFEITCFHCVTGYSYEKYNDQSFMISNIDFEF